MLRQLSEIKTLIVLRKPDLIDTILLQTELPELASYKSFSIPEASQVFNQALRAADRQLKALAECPGRNATRSG